MSWVHPRGGQASRRPRRDKTCAAHREQQRFTMRLPWSSKDGGQQCVPLKKPLLGGVRPWAAGSLLSPLDLSAP
jgi:hypothetical protein